MRGALRLVIDFLGVFNVRPSAQFMAGVGIGTGIGMTLQHSLRSSPPTPLFFDEEELMLEWRRRFIPALPPVDATVACPAAGYRIGFPACYPIDAPPPPNFPLEPVDTTIACPAAGYTITFPACYPIDAPPSPVVPVPTSLVSKITEPICALVSSHSQAITGVLAPSLYHLLDSVTPASSGARRHLVYLQPLMAVFAIHYIWFVIVALLLSLEPDALSCQLQFILATAGDHVKAVVEAAGIVWAALQPAVVDTDELPYQEPALLYHLRMSKSPLGESTSLFDLAEPAPLPGSAAAVVTPAGPLSSASSDCTRPALSPSAVLSPSSKPLPPLPSDSSPLIPDAPTDTPAVETTVPPVAGEPRHRLAPYVRKRWASPTGGDMAPGVDRALIVRRATIPSMAVPSDVLDEIRRRYPRLSLERGSSKGKDTVAADSQQNPKVARLLENTAGAYPSPRDTPVYGLKEQELKRTRRRANRTPSPSKPRARRSSLRQPIVGSPVPDYDMFEMVMHTLTSTHDICPPHLADDNDATWRPAHLSPLPAIESCDDSRAPTPDNLLDDFPDSPPKRQPSLDVFRFTSPFVPTHASSLRDRPKSLDSMSSLELSPFKGVDKAQECVQSSPAGSTSADPISLGSDHLPNEVNMLASQHPCSWKRVKVLASHTATHLTVRVHPVSRELLVVKRVKVLGMVGSNGAAFEKEARVLRAASEASKSSQWCSRFVGTFGDKRDMYLLSVYCPNGNMIGLIKAQNPRCLNAKLARFYLAEMVVALKALHSTGNVWHCPRRAVTADEDPDVLIRRGLLPFEEACMLDYIEMLQAYQEMYTGKPFTLNPATKKPLLDHHSNPTALQNLTDLDRLFMNMVVEKVSGGVLPTRHVLAHNIFDGIDWSAIERQEVPVPDLEPVPHLRLRNRVHTCLEQPLQWDDVSKDSWRYPGW